MPSESTALARTLANLSQVCLNSQGAYAYAAQHTRNRGLKLLLKSYAHERAHFRDQLREQGAMIDSHLPERPSSGGLGRGLANVRAWFVVRRQARQRLLLRQAMAAEQAALAAYQEAERTDLPAALASLIRDQHASSQAALRRLQALAAQRTGAALLVRLYDEPAQVNQVVTGLQKTGVAQEDIYLADVRDLAPDGDDAPQRERARWETMAASALIGALIGAVIILPFAIGLRMYLPEVNGIFATTPAGVLFEYVVGGLLVGAIFGLYFSIFIAQDIVEDDAYLTAEGLDKGTLLVAVPATAANRAAVERVLGLQHQFEVQPKPA